jgi:uncharacterized SAM-binding protein YcdF (DUF218 family)
MRPPEKIPLPVYLRFERLTIRVPRNYHARFTMSVTMNDASSRFRVSRRSFFWLGGSIVLLLSAITAFLHAGTWLIREDYVEKAQIVVVLSGGLPERALAAADEFKASGAQEVWLTRPSQPGAAMEQLHLPYAGEEQYSRMVLIDRGVPPTAIRTLAPQINNTADELQAVFDELNPRPAATVIVITSKAHTRRVRAIWNVISQKADRGRLLVRAAPQDGFDADHWWRSTKDALSVVREYLGLLNAWAGLPLRPTG